MNRKLNHSPSLQSLKVFVLLAVITWVAHFWYCYSFGLYEDDLHRIPQIMGASWGELWEQFFYHVQGRPLHGGFICLFSFLGMKIGGLPFIYGIAYGIVTANSFLFYVLVKRLSGDQVFAVTGALAFCLFPADTTQAFLTHSLGVQPSLMFLLIAFLSYLSGRKKFSYLVILGSLFCYETVVPLFLAAPLLTEKWDSKLAGKLGRHFLIMGILVVCVVILRIIHHDGRMHNIRTLSALGLSTRHALKNIFTGPFVAMSMFLYRPVQVLLAWNKEMVMFLPLCFAGFVWTLCRLKPDPLGADQETSQKSSEVFNFMTKAALTGVIMLLLAYPLTLRLSATGIDGRASRVHTAAVVGASLLVAWACSWIFSVAIRDRQKGLAACVLAVIFTLWVGFGLTVQRDYRISWQYERAFWTDVIRLCPDMTNGTVILFEQRHLKQTDQIKTRDWGISVLLNSLYQFPREWKRVPSVYRLKPGWRKKVVLKGNTLHFREAVFWMPPAYEHPVKSSNVIFLEAKQGRLIRRVEPLKIGGREFRLKENSASVERPLFPKKPLYNYLIQDRGEETISYLQ